MDYKQLDFRKRCQIYGLWKAGYNQTEIAKEVGVNIAGLEIINAINNSTILNFSFCKGSAGQIHNTFHLTLRLFFWFSGRWIYHQTSSDISDNFYYRI